MSDFYSLFGRVCDRYGQLFSDAQKGFNELCQKSCYECHAPYPQDPDVADMCANNYPACTHAQNCTTDEKCKIVSKVWQNLLVMDNYLNTWFQMFYEKAGAPSTTDYPVVPCISPPSYQNYYIGDCNESNCTQYMQDALNYLDAKSIDTGKRFNYLFGKCTDEKGGSGGGGGLKIVVIVLGVLGSLYVLGIILNSSRRIQRRRQLHNLRIDQQAPLLGQVPPRVQQPHIQPRPLLQDNVKNTLLERLQKIKTSVDELPPSKGRERFQKCINLFQEILVANRFLSPNEFKQQLLKQRILYHAENRIATKDQIGNFINILERLFQIPEKGIINDILRKSERSFEMCYEGGMREFQNNLLQQQRKMEPKSPVNPNAFPKLPEDFSNDPVAKFAEYISYMFQYYQAHIQHSTTIDEFIKWCLENDKLSPAFEILKNPRNQRIRNKFIEDVSKFDQFVITRQMVQQLSTVLTQNKQQKIKDADDIIKRGIVKFLLQYNKNIGVITLEGQRLGTPRYREQGVGGGGGAAQVKRHEGQFLQRQVYHEKMI